MNRSEAARYRYVVNKSRRAVRPCLWCGRKFLSTGAGNRKCPKCKKRTIVDHEAEALVYPHPFKAGEI